MVVHVRDERGLHRKIAAVQTAGIDSFHVVSDFDLTLSKSVIDGKKVPSLFGLVRGGNYLDRDYPQQAYALYDQYRPLENDPTLSDGERIQKMQEWWSAHADIMVQYGMSRSVIKKVVADHGPILKDGADTFLYSLKENKVPLLVFSSGLGDLITGFLERDGLLLPNMHVIANFFDFDSAGNALGYTGRILHTYNKNEATLDEEYFSFVRERRNVLLLGDSLGDPHMVDGLDHDTVIRVGFCYDENRLDAYLSLYDVVLTDDDTLTYVNELSGLLMKK